MHNGAKLRSERTLCAKLLRRPWILGSGLAAICFATAAGLSLANWPVPRVHDEFSYLLAADTFAHGRLSNPTHPHWQHFETFHVIHLPTYASKYPPGQGAALALGQWLTGEPLVGAWITSALAAAATYWLLYGCTTPRLALLGSCLWLASAKYQIAWGQSYWGGTLAYLGGALLFGGALRLRGAARVRDAVAMAVGALVLAVTRPFEGLALCVAVGIWLVASWSRTRAIPVRVLVCHAVLPQAVILAFGLAGLAAYNKAVAGDPWTLPYSVHQAAYGQTPLFVWQSPPPKPAYRHQALDDFHSNWELDWHRRQSTVGGWLKTKASMTVLLAEFFFPSILALGLLCARPLRWPRLTPIAAIAAATYAASLAATWNLAHYLAPLGPLLLVVALAGLRRVDALSRRRLGGFRAIPALVGLQVALFAIVAVRVGQAPQRGWHIERARLSEQLHAAPRKQLVLVRYGSQHDPLEEWVFNAADIDGAQVVWARSMGAEPDEALRRYFADRQAWLLEPDQQRLVRLPRCDRLDN